MVVGLEAGCSHTAHTTTHFVHFASFFTLVLFVLPFCLEVKGSLSLTSSTNPLQYPAIYMPKRSLPHRHKERSKSGQAAVDLNWDDNIESSDDEDGNGTRQKHTASSSESEEELTVEQQRKK